MCFKLYEYTIWCVWKFKGHIQGNSKVSEYITVYGPLSYARFDPTSAIDVDFCTWQVSKDYDDDRIRSHRRWCFCNKITVLNVDILES